ncbi:MAG: adenylate/guanylate cyclase domain-containing protein [Anaerolineae bacterium]|nr:MAG: adenylate/guanylate cyclase domain-containing protein [Anaerolineae bacterium]
MLAFSAFGVVSFLLYVGWHKNMDAFLTSIAIPALPAHLLAVSWAGGFLNAGGMPIWGLFYPALGYLIFYGFRPGVLWFVLFMLTFGLSLFVPVINPNPAEVPFETGLALLVMNVGFIATMIFGVMGYFVSQRETAYRLLEGEQERSENLLLNILPKEIAAILKAEPRTIAEHFEGASVLFADVVNFTPMSAQMQPVELVELLNEVFSHFDDLADDYKLEKIKTIGDCYMVAAGVPNPRPDHAQVITRMALAMREHVTTHEVRGRKLAFRIGINSGPVVAGVIGRKKFIYDLWGDAVNTASRMESHGAGGVIQVTRATYDLIKDEFSCEPRGTVHVKGKGEMDVWHVMGPRP